MVINSWMFKINLGALQMRKTKMNPMKITAMLSSFFLLRMYEITILDPKMFVRIDTIPNYFSFNNVIA